MKTTRKYHVDLDFFQHPSPEMAWVLGVIASDGHVVNDGKSWGVTSKDKCFLEKVSSIINNERPIRKRKNADCYNLIISSVQMVKDLSEIGITISKSLSLQ